jgi:hypothetical protein
MRQGQAIAAAVLALAVSSPLQSQAMTSPALLDPKALAGTWTLTGPGSRICHLVLKAEAALGGPGLALELGDCAGWAGPIGQAASWQASNDGFGLATADRSTVLFFGNEGGGLFAARARDGTRYELRRKG